LEALMVDVPLELLIENASEDELRTIVGVLKRAHAKPAIVVTVTTPKGKHVPVEDSDPPRTEWVQIGTKDRRYVVSAEDEGELRPLVGLTGDKLKQALDRLYRWGGPGGRWLRQMGKVDEMHVCISGDEISRVQAIDRDEVFGTKPPAPVQLALEVP
jgi:hypothetical protein